MNSKLAVRVGSQRPTRVHLPSDKHGSAGREAVELAAIAGLHLYEWQQWVLEESMAERANGKWAATEVVLNVPRQNGKGSVIEARQIAGLFLLGEADLVHSAHEYKTCADHFRRITTLIEGCAELDRRVAKVRRGSGEQAVELKSGARLRFVARSAGSGRGFTGDSIYLDEAYALTFDMMAAMKFTQSASRTGNRQAWYTSSQAMPTSDVLHSVRRRAMNGDSPRMFFAEWGADADCDIRDRDVWYATNPTLGLRIDEETVAEELAGFADRPELFARERLGIPDGEDGAAGVVPIELWNSLVAPYEMAGSARLALDVSADLRWSSIAAVQDDAEGIAHLEVIDRREGTEWLAGRAIELCRRFQVPISVPMNGPAVAQVPLLRAGGVDVVEVGATDVMRAAAGFVDACANKRLRHLGSESMRNAITGAAVKTVGDLTQWGRATSTSDITPLVACSIALAAHVPLTFVF